MRSKKLLILFLIILFATLQCTVINYFQIFKIKPDILLILITFFSLYYGQIYGMIIGALCGLFSELTCGVPAGLMVLIYSLGGLLLGYIGKWIYNHTIASQFYISFVFSLATCFVLFVFFQILNVNISFLNAFLFTILPTSFYSACIAPFLFSFLKMIFSIK